MAKGAGVSAEKVVQERLGHSQLSMMLDTYSHVAPPLQREAGGGASTSSSTAGVSGNSSGQSNREERGGRGSGADDAYWVRSHGDEERSARLDAPAAGITLHPLAGRGSAPAHAPRRGLAGSLHVALGRGRLRFGRVYFAVM